jgi:hypothetical protein
LFEARPDLRCVWSDAPLRPANFDIDHVIPFALWRNNDLWNLLPADRRVNGRKSDALPTAALLRRRRDAILRCWEVGRTAMGPRFRREADALVGRPTWDPPALFDVVAECVEVTALDRVASGERDRKARRPAAPSPGDCGPRRQRRDRVPSRDARPLPHGGLTARPRAGRRFRGGMGVTTARQRSVAKS